MVFVKLVPPSVATEAELLEFVRQHVDEPPARPKSVPFLQTMPMTSVDTQVNIPGAYACLQRANHGVAHLAA